MGSAFGGWFVAYEEYVEETGEGMICLWILLSGDCGSYFGSTAPC